MYAPIARLVLITALLAGAALTGAGTPSQVPQSTWPAAFHAPTTSVIPNAYGWQDELVDTRGRVGFLPAIALDSSGYPHIAYYDSTHDSLKYAAWDGVAWQMDTVESSLGGISDTYGLRSSLALYGGTAYIVYEKNDNLTSNRSVRYAFGGIGGWNISTVSLVTPHNFAHAPMLRMDGNHNLHVTYTLENSGQVQIIYARLGFTGTHWLSQTVDRCDCYSMDTTLTLDSSNRPHIAYASASGGLPVKYAWLNGATWQFQTVDMDGRWPSIAVDTAGIAHVAYVTGGSDIKYASWNGSTWQIENVSTTCQCDADTAPSLALDVLGRPRIAVGVFLQDVLKFLAFDGTNWHYDIVTNLSVDPDEPALALDAAGNAHIIYLDAQYNELHHVAWAPNWLTQTVALTGDEAHLVVDLHNLPYISYSTNPLPAYYHVQLANWTPGGYWQYREALPFSAGDHAMRLEYDLNRQPLPIFSYIDLSDLSRARLGFAQWDGTSFFTQTVDSSNGTGFDSSLAFDQQANPIIGYIDLNGGGHPLLKLATSSTYGFIWNTHTDTAAPVLGINSGLRALSVGGSPVSTNVYLAYWESTSNALRLATWNGAQWTDQLIDGGNGVTTGQRVSLAVDRTSGKPAMAYLTADGLRYAFWRGAWLTQTMDSGAQAVSDVALWLALYSDQYPRIAYAARVDKSLRLAWTTAPTGTWTIESVASFAADPTLTFPQTRVSSQTQTRDHIAFSSPSTGVVYAFRSATLPYSIYFNPLQPCVDSPPPPMTSLGHTLPQVRALAPTDLEQVDDLTTLRALRDLFALSPGGRYYINLYYQYAPEAGTLALHDPALLWDAYRTLENWLPGFLALAAGQGGSRVITQSMIDHVNNIADRLAAAGSPALGTAINTERGKYNHLQDFVGETFDQAATTLGVAAHAVYLPLVRR